MESNKFYDNADIIIETFRKKLKNLNKRKYYDYFWFAWSIFFGMRNFGQGEFIWAGVFVALLALQIFLHIHNNVNPRRVIPYIIEYFEEEKTKREMSISENTPPEVN